MMEKYEMRRQIGPSICDASGKLSHAEAFGLFMDIPVSIMRRCSGNPV